MRRIVFQLFEVHVIGPHGHDARENALDAVRSIAFVARADARCMWVGVVA